jgi:hypothetical protein
VRCRDATASSFVAKLRGGVFTHFHAVAISGIDCLTCQDEFFLSMLLTLLFTCLAFLGLTEFGLSVYGSCFLPQTFFLIIARVSSTLFLRFAQNLLPFLCRIHCEFTSGQKHDSKQKDIKIRTSTQLREILNTDSQDMPLQRATTTVVHIGSTSLGNYGFVSYI